MKGSSFLSLAKYLKKARLDASLTQNEVAAKFGFSSAQYVSNWERGLAAPPLENLVKLIELYGLDPNRLTKEILDVQKRIFQRQFELKKQKIELLLLGKSAS
jgi:transcriptional regulator with XRE-family HTH domain